jgi:hypothetical protein
VGYIATGDTQSGFYAQPGVLNPALDSSSVPFAGATGRLLPAPAKPSFWLRVPQSSIAPRMTSEEKATREQE